MNVSAGKDLVFRINVTYYGEYEPTIVNQSSMINFYKVHSEVPKEVWLVTDTGNYNNEKLVAYDSNLQKKFWWGRNATLYFGASSEGGDPDGFFFKTTGQEDIYTGFIIICETLREYSQSYPLIGIEIK